MSSSAVAQKSTVKPLCVIGGSTAAVAGVLLLLYAIGIITPFGHAFAHTKAHAWLNSYISFVPHKYATTWGAGIAVAYGATILAALTVLGGVEIYQAGK